MQASTVDKLRSRQLGLLAAFREHIQELQELRRRAEDEFLPEIVKQEGVSDDEMWSLAFLDDDASLFRTFMRHKFTAKSAKVALRDTLRWRLDVVRKLSPLQNHVFRPLELLPLTQRDCVGRLVAVLHVRHLDLSSNTLRDEIVLSLESMRRNMCSLNAKRPSCGRGCNPMLQYALVVDLADASPTSVCYDTISWYLREVQPHFYGIIGTIFIVNYGWAHMSVWQVAKRVLPASVNAKIIFCNREELDIFLRSETPGSSRAASSSNLSDLQSEDLGKCVTDATNPRKPISRTPIQSNSHLRGGKGKWRGFARTLCLLYWRKWKNVLGAGFMVGLFVLISLRMRRTRMFWSLMVNR